MTAASIVERLELHHPGIEVITATAVDGYTIESQRFNTIVGASATLNTATTTAVDLGVTVSGSTATVRGIGLNGESITVVLYGRMGN